MTDSRPRRLLPHRLGPRETETAVFGVLVNFGRNSKEKGRLPRNAISYKHLVIYEQSSYTFVYSSSLPGYDAGREKRAILNRCFVTKFREFQAIRVVKPES